PVISDLLTMVAAPLNHMLGLSLRSSEQNKILESLCQDYNAMRQRAIQGASAETLLQLAEAMRPQLNQLHTNVKRQMDHMDILHTRAQQVIAQADEIQKLAKHFEVIAPE